MPRARAVATHPDIDALRSPILRAIGRHLDLNTYQVFVFGSRAMGTAHSRSDFDIGIEGPREVPIGTMAAIRDELEELPTIHTIEFLDMHATSPVFQRLARRKIIPLN